MSSPIPSPIRPGISRIEGRVIAQRGVDASHRAVIHETTIVTGVPVVGFMLPVRSPSMPNPPPMKTTKNRSTTAKQRTAQTQVAVSLTRSRRRFHSASIASAHVGHQSCDSVSLHGWQHGAVHVERERSRMMSEPFLDNLRMDTGRQQRCGVTVSETVQRDHRKIGPSDEVVEPT